MESLFTLDLPAALAWQNLGLCLLGMAAGTLIGTFLGTLPTFVAASVMLVGLPLSGSTAAAILAGVFCGALYGTSLSVVLAGAPARPPDGPAAEKPAQARPGAGALLVASLLGSTVATLVALLLGCAVLLVFVAVPGNLMTAIALAMGNPEFVALIAVFLVLVVALGGGTPPKALVMMMLGLALAYVSADGEHGEPSESQDRYITLLALGLVTFAAALVRLRAVNVTPPAPLRPWLPRRKDLMQIVRPALRGGGVGLLLGLLPMEILVLRFVAYRIEQGLAKDRARNPSARRGMIELGAGVLPIGPIMAITAAVMVLPGPLPFIEEPALFWSTVAAMWTGNMIVLTLGLGLAGACVRLLLVPRHIILGAVILAGCASIYMAYSSFADVGAAIILGILGFALMKYGFEPIPLLIGFSLEPYLNEQLQRTLLISRGSFLPLVEHPISAALLVIAILLLISIFYGALVLFNPLLRQVSAGPAGLLSLQIDDLPRARLLLQAAFRLRSALAGANVARKGLDTAIKFVRIPAPKARARALADRLELHLDGAMQTTNKGIAFIDAATSERLLLNLPCIRLAFPPAGIAADEILADLRRTHTTNDWTTVIVPTDRQQDTALRAITADRTELAATLSGSELTGVFLSPHPLTVFAQALSQQIPPARLSAYQRGGGVSRAGVFFGREKEIATVLNREPANYFLVGSRQVGKTSLLKELKRRIDTRGEVDCVYLSLFDDDLRGPLVNALKIDPDTTLDAAYAHLTRADSRLRYLFIDEADRFIVREARTGYRDLAMFRRLSEEGRVHFIFAGYRYLYRTMAFEYDSPLRNFGEQIRLGTLDEAACWRLATEPMAALNLHYEAPELATEIYRATAGHAHLMTTACDEIIKSLTRQERVISSSLVHKVLHGFEMRSQLEGWSDLNHIDNDAGTWRATRLDRIVVYSTAHADAFTFMDVQHSIADAGLDYTADELRESLTRLTLAVVVDSDDGAHYHYCIPIFLEFLRTQDLDQARNSAIAEAASARP